MPSSGCDHSDWTYAPEYGSRGFWIMTSSRTSCWPSGKQTKVWLPDESRPILRENVCFLVATPKSAVSLGFWMLKATPPRPDYMRVGLQG